MKQSKFYVVFALLLMVSMVLTACQQPTAAPKATDVPQAAFKAEKLAAPDCKYGGNLSSVESVDQYTVKFTFCEPEPAFLAKVSLAVFGIHDADALKASGGDVAKVNAAPIGTGPYVVKEWVRGDHITFEANPNYWGAAPKTKTVIFRWSKEAAQRKLELESGTVDGIDNPGTDDIAAIEANKNLKNYQRPTPNLLYLGINVDTPPWNNEKVRQALAMAIDRDRLIKNFYPPGTTAAQQFVPPSVKPGYTDGLKWYDFNKAEAKKILEAEKFDFTKEYQLYYAERTRAYFPQPTKIATDIQAQLAEIGIKIKLELLEWATYLPLTREGKTPLFLLGWGEDYPDATDWYDVFLTGTSKSFGTAFADIVAQIKVGATSADPAVRQKAYDEVNKLFKQHVPNIPLTHNVTYATFKAEIENVKIGPYNENFEEMVAKSGKLVWSQNGEPVSLMCADETDGDSFRTCDMTFGKLYDFQYGTAIGEPQLAEKCTPDKDMKVWTCALKKGVKFSNGAAFDAADVFATFTMIWDAKNPYHKGNTGNFQYLADFFGGFLNPPPAK